MEMEDCILMFGIAEQARPPATQASLMRHMRRPRETRPHEHHQLRASGRRHDEVCSPGPAPRYVS